MAFPSFRTASTPVRVDDSTLTLDVPSGYQPGDILFAAVAAQETFTPSGWTLLGEYEDINGVGIGLYWRKAAEGEPASYTFSVSTNSANGALGVIVAYETLSLIHI